MTDLRDQLAEFEAAARRLLGHTTLVLVDDKPARCHPGRRLWARTLCKPCYDYHHWRGTLHRFPLLRPRRSRTHFIADYELLRSEGYTRRQIAERLGMKLMSLRRAYYRAVNAGELTPDRRVA